MASAHGHKAPYSERILIDASLQRDSLSALVPSLWKGSALKEKIEIFPELSTIVGHENGKKVLKLKIRYWEEKDDPSYIIAGVKGTGKKTLALAIIRQYVEKRGAILFNLTASTIESSSTKGTIKKIQDLFKVAVLNQPSVVFIPRLQDFFHKGISPDDASGEILVQMKALEKTYGVLIIGLTTIPELLHDITFKRFKRIIYCPPPSPQERIDLVKLFLQGSWSNMTKDQFNKIAAETNGYTREDIENMVKDTVEMVRNQKNSNGRKLITMHHFTDSILMRDGGSLDKREDRKLYGFLTRVGGTIIV